MALQESACRVPLEPSAREPVRKMHSFIGFAYETIGGTLPKPPDCTK